MSLVFGTLFVCMVLIHTSVAFSSSSTAARGPDWSFLHRNKNRLTILRQSTKASSSSRANRIPNLLEWAATQQIAVSKAIHLKADPVSGLGWVAKSPIQPNDLLLTVPQSMALVVDDDFSLTQNRWTRDNNVDPVLIQKMPWFVQMSLHLQSLSSSSHHQPWLEALPRTLSTPIHWHSDTKTTELHYTPLQQAVQQQSQTWQTYYDQLQLKKTRLSFQDFVWGCEMARSRAFAGVYGGGSGSSIFNPYLVAFLLLLVTAYVGLGLGTIEQAANGAAVVFCAGIFQNFIGPKLFGGKRGKQQKSYVICPVLDMANHDASHPNAKVSYEFFGQAYSLTATQAIAPHQAVTISYGTRSNDQLLQYYGFVVVDNPHDVYVLPPLREWDLVPLEAATGRTFAPGRLIQLERAGLLGGSTHDDGGDNMDDDSSATTGSNKGSNPMGGVVVSRGDGMDPAVMQALRALVSTDNEWKAAREAIGNFATENSGGSANEQCARLVARTVLELELATKPTTLEQDQELFRRMETSISMDDSQEDKLAVMFRIEKKKLLLETIEKLK